MKKRIYTFVFLFTLLPGFVFGQQKKEIVIDGNPYISTNSRYPVIERKGVLYFPLTANNLRALGLEYEFRSGRLEINKSKELPSDHLLFYPDDPSKDEVKVFDFISLLKTYPMDPKYPLLKYKDVLYFPMTWRNCTEIMGWNFQYKDKVLHIDTKKDLYYVAKENINVAVGNRVYQLEDFDIYEKKEDSRRLIYRLPKIAADIHLSIVDNKLHLMYRMGQSQNSQERHVIFEEEPREIYSGKYNYLVFNGQEYLLQRDIIRSNIFRIEEDELVDFTKSKLVYRTEANDFNNFTENIARMGSKLYLLASSDGLTYDRIVSIDEGEVKVVLQDRFLRGFTEYGNQLLVYNDFGIYRYDVKTGTRKVLLHTDAVRVFPSKTPIYIHQNLSLYQGEEDLNPMGKVNGIKEAKDGDHIYTLIQFSGDAKYQNILLEDGKIIYRGKFRMTDPTISGGAFHYYLPRSDKIYTIPFEEKK